METGEIIQGKGKIKYCVPKEETKSCKELKWTNVQTKNASKKENKGIFKTIMKCGLYKLET